LIAAARKSATAVFSGKVMSIENQSTLLVRVTFLVESAWKGQVAKSVTIQTGGGGGDCGYRFEIGERYLVYAYGSAESLSTNICQRTRPLSASAVDRKSLKKPRKIYPEAIDSAHSNRL
jgi:hypothetical protein